MTDWKKKFASATEKARTLINEVQENEKVMHLKEKTKKVLEDSGIAEKYESANETMSEHFDTISGTKQLLLVEERLALQTQYNDILASKLHEALGRIEKLEACVNSLQESVYENRRIS